jgi:hypothetical protein
MSSTRHVEPLDEMVEWAAALTPEENEWLWRVRELDWLPWDQYLAWCSYLTKDEPPSREIHPPDIEPFTLP